jgi:hypothetical protein
MVLTMLAICAVLVLLSAPAEKARQEVRSPRARN